MEDFSFSYCEPAPSDVIPMIVIVCLFILATRLLRRWKKKRNSKSEK